MMKAVWSGIAAAGPVVGFSATAYAQVVSTPLTVTVNVNAKAKLTLDVGAIAFADADPDVTAVMTSPDVVTIHVKARTSSGSNVTLTMQADGDLVSGVTDVINIGGLSWTATGAGYVAGTANKGAAQSVGLWTGSGNPSGTNTFSLPNSWSYATGAYHATLTYTLTVP